jgi:hypothetical protein
LFELVELANGNASGAGLSVKREPEASALTAITAEAAAGSVVAAGGSQPAGHGGA